MIVGENLVDDGFLNIEKLSEWTREYQDLLESAPVIPQEIFSKEKGKIVKKKRETGAINENTFLLPGLRTID